MVQSLLMAAEPGPVGASQLSVSTSDETWQATLRWLEQRNGPIDLAAASIADAGSLGPVFRSRVLVVNEDRLVVERPQRGGASRALSDGQSVVLWAMDDIYRWAMDASVLGVARHSLNPKTVIQSLHLSWPTQVVPAQRRDAFRVSTVGLKIAPLTMFPTGTPRADEYGRYPVPETFPASLVNISRSGMGVEVRPDEGHLAEAFDQFNCTLRLPGEEKPIALKTRQVWHEARYSGTHYLGLEFVASKDINQRRVGQAIESFTNYVQRQGRRTHTS